MKIELHQISGLAMAGFGESGHWIAMDGPESFGGFSAASRPLELMLMSLAGCTGMDVVSILRKKRLHLDDFRMEVNAEQTKEHPKVFTDITLRFFFTGVNIRRADVESAIQLSQEKYCAVTAMLKESVSVSYDYLILRSDA